ncbi:MAG: hypothetical protein AAB575_03810 [Patescibacteria group bacterium]
MPFENAALQKKQQPENLPASERPTRPELRVIEGGKGKDEFEDLVDPKLVALADNTKRRIQQLDNPSVWNKETDAELLEMYEEVVANLEGEIDAGQVESLKSRISQLRKTVNEYVSSQKLIRDIPVLPLARPRAVGSQEVSVKPAGIFGKVANWFK